MKGIGLSIVNVNYKRERECNRLATGVAASQREDERKCLRNRQNFFCFFVFFA